MCVNKTLKPEAGGREGPPALSGGIRRPRPSPRVCAGYCLGLTDLSGNGAEILLDVLGVHKVSIRRFGDLEIRTKNQCTSNEIEDLSMLQGYILDLRLWLSSLSKTAPTDHMSMRRDPAILFTRLLLLLLLTITA